jgi:hypothetical protein
LSIVKGFITRIDKAHVAVQKPVESGHFQERTQEITKGIKFENISLG